MIRINVHECTHWYKHRKMERMENGKRMKATLKRSYLAFAASATRNYIILKYNGHVEYGSIYTLWAIQFGWGGEKWASRYRSPLFDLMTLSSCVWTRIIVFQNVRDHRDSKFLMGLWKNINILLSRGDLTIR